jgi:hypothetical protein
MKVLVLYVVLVLGVKGGEGQGKCCTPREWQGFVSGTTMVAVNGKKDPGSSEPPPAQWGTFQVL